MLCSILIAALTGCGVTYNPPQSNPVPVISTVTITATSGSLQHTTTLTLTLN